MKASLLACILVSCLGLYVCPPVEKDMKEVHDNMYLDTDGMNETQAQEVEYYRYLTQVVTELEKDEKFKEKVQNITDEDIKSGKAAELYDIVGHNIRRKLDEIKRREVEYQREVIREEKHHMVGYEKNYWNPVHHDDKETFHKEDLRKLLNKHNDMIAEQDKTRHDEFKKYELEKEHQRREAMKNMTVEQKKVEETKHVETHHKTHDKLHEPGHKAQLEEVWEKEDGLDPDSFDTRTLFNLHDKNSDGYLDYFELETLFLTDLNKVYNESDPETDMYERDEEINRMREHVMKTMDTDRDGLISRLEFKAETEGEDFKKDDEWKPLTEEDQFTEDELGEYEHYLEKLAAEHEPEEKGHDKNAGDHTVEAKSNGDHAGEAKKEEHKG